MSDVITCALRELKRRKLRTLAGLSGFFLGCMLITAMVLMLQYDLQAKNALVNYMGNKFLAYAPMNLIGVGDEPAVRPLDPVNEGFFTEPTVVTRLLPANLAASIAKIPEVGVVTPFLLYRFKNSQDGHVFSIGGIRPADVRALQATLISRHDIISGVFFQQNDRNVVIVDKSYADMWNLKVGSVVNIGDTLFPIIGIAGSHARTARADVYMNWPDAEAAISRRLNRPLNNEANLFLIEATGAETVAVAMQKVQALVEQGITNSVVCSIPVVKFMGLSQNSVCAVMMIVAVLAMLFAGNAQWSAASERAHEVAVLKAIGWRDRSIFAQFIVESMLVSLAGGMLGAGAGYAMFRTIARVMGARIDAAYQVVDVPATLVLLIFATALAGIIAGLVPAVRAAATRPAEVLRDLN